MNLSSISYHGVGDWNGAAWPSSCSIPLQKFFSPNTIYILYQIIHCCGDILCILQSLVTSLVSAHKIPVVRTKRQPKVSPQEEAIVIWEPLCWPNLQAPLSFTKYVLLGLLGEWNEVPDIQMWCKSVCHLSLRSGQYQSQQTSKSPVSPRWKVGMEYWIRDYEDRKHMNQQRRASEEVVHFNLWDWKIKREKSPSTIDQFFFFLIMHILSIVTVIVKIPYSSLMATRKAMTWKSWPWLLWGSFFPHPFFPVTCHGLHACREYGVLSCSSPRGSLPFVCMSSQPLVLFFPVISSFFSVQLLEAVLSPHRQTFGSCSVSISIKALNMVCSEWDSAEFICLLLHIHLACTEPVPDSFPHPPAPDSARNRQGSTSAFELKKIG